MRALPETPGLIAALLLCLLFVVAAAAYRQYSSVHNPNLFSELDERIFHAPEIERLAQGGALIARNTRVAMIPGYHALLSAIPPRWRPNAHALLCGLSMLALLLLARTLLPAQPRLATVIWLCALIGPYALGMSAWITTDPVGLGLFALTLSLFANAEREAGWAQALIIALAAVACTLVRSIYLPALMGLFALAALLPGLGASRKAALLALLAIGAASLPFLLRWHGLTPPELDSNHALGLYRSDLLSQLFWAGVLAPVLLLARRHWLSFQPLLPHLGVGALMALGLLLPGLEVLTLNDSPGILHSGSLLYSLERLHLPAELLLAVRILGVVAGGTLISYAISQLWQHAAPAGLALLGIGLYLASLVEQPRPYQHYFEVLLLFALVALLQQQLSEKPLRYLPLLALFAAYAAAFHLFIR